MKSKRKSILVRMLRPVSVAFGVWLVILLRTEIEREGLFRSLMSCALHPEMEFDLDKALEEVPIHLEDLPHASPRPAATAPPLDGPWPTSLNLPAPPTPTELPPPLEHHTKSRPKPRKRNRPSRPAVRGQ